MAIVNTKASIHRVTVPTATASDVVTAVGVNKYLNGLNGETTNGVLIAQFNAGMEPNIYTTGVGINPGPGPSMDLIETPALCINMGGTSPGSVFSNVVDSWGELPDKYTHIYCAIDVSWIRPEGYARVYLNSPFGAIWMFLEITPNRILSNAFPLSAGLLPTAVETGVGRHFIQFEVPIAANILPPAGKAEKRLARILYAHYRPTHDGQSPYAGTNQGIWSCNIYAIKK